MNAELPPLERAFVFEDDHNCEIVYTTESVDARERILLDRITALEWQQGQWAWRCARLEARIAELEAEVADLSRRLTTESRRVLIQQREDARAEADKLRNQLAAPQPQASAEDVALVNGVMSRVFSKERREAWQRIRALIEGVAMTPEGR